MPRNLAIVAAVWFAVTAGEAMAQTEPKSNADPDVIDAGIDRAQRMTVPVTVDGKGPFSFVVDTGADRTVVSRELADRLRLASNGSAMMHTMAGVGSVDTVRVPLLEVGGGRTADISAPALAQVNLGAHGLLGVDSLQGRRVEMDFGKGTLTVVSSKVRERINPDTIVVTARSRYGQLILVDSDIGGTPITVIVDSGAQNSVGNIALRDMLARRKKVRDFYPITLTDVTGRELPAEVAVVHSMRIGGFTINDIAVAFVDAHPFKRFGLEKKPAMLLGMGTLRAFHRVSVDFAARKVRFLLPDTSLQTSRDKWFAFRSQGTTLPPLAAVPCGGLADARSSSPICTLKKAAGSPG